MMLRMTGSLCWHTSSCHGHGGNDWLDAAADVVVYDGKGLIENSSYDRKDKVVVGGE